MKMINKNIGNIILMELKFLRRFTNHTLEGLAPEVPVATDLREYGYLRNNCGLPEILRYKPFPMLRFF
jgi:hypothetical protein